MEDQQEKDLSDLCVGKSLDELQRVADWSYFTSEGESLDEYWSERDGFERGVHACGKHCFAAFVGCDEDQEVATEHDDTNNDGLVLMFAGDSFEEVKEKLTAALK